MTGGLRRLFSDPSLLMLSAVVLFAVTGGSLAGPILPAIMDL